MAHDDGAGELSGETLEEGAQALALGFRAGVTGLTGSIETAFVTDADAVVVVILAVGTDLLQRTSLVNMSVPGDVIMIADILEASLQVVGPTALKTIVLRDARGAAVQNDEGNASHCLNGLKLLRSGEGLKLLSFHAAAGGQ